MPDSTGILRSESTPTKTPQTPLFSTITAFTQTFFPGWAQSQTKRAGLLSVSPRQKLDSLWSALLTAGQSKLPVINIMQPKAQPLRKAQ